MVARYQYRVAVPFRGTNLPNSTSYRVAVPKAPQRLLWLSPRRTRFVPAMTGAGRAPVRGYNR